MNMRILIVEDDAVLTDGLLRVFKQAGYAVDHANNGEQAKLLLRDTPYQLVLLDIGLPKLNGLEVLRWLRSVKNEVPVLILTAFDAVEDRVRGLDYGADDYITKPFNLSELEARVRALIRRSQYGGQPQLRVGRLSLDQHGRQAYVDGKPFELSARESSILEALMLRPGRVVLKEQLLEQIYSWDEEVSVNAIEVCMHRLRKKLEDIDINIRTIRGLGYLIDVHQEVDGTAK
jgi:two-component system OmpR family response regulator